jgi:DNA mismatch repair ATPase MutS
MTFKSILFKRTDDFIRNEEPEAVMPDFFVDLNLDQIINAITSGKEAYNLNPFFLSPLRDIDEIKYRHEIMQDLENTMLFEHIRLFAEKMQTVREQLVKTDKFYYKYQKDRLFLDVVEIYCEALVLLAKDLDVIHLKSQGLLSFSEYLTAYLQSDRFTSLYTETKKIIAGLSSVKYCVLMYGLSVQVSDYESETDYSAEVEETFAKFKQGDVRDYKVGFPVTPEMNHVEAQILDGVAQLHPELFLQLETFYTDNHDFMNETIRIFDREIQFYMAFLEYAVKFRQAGLKFCYPQISTAGKEVYDYEGFDLALANKLITENTSVVTNDFYLEGKERILVVSGPNQGGKTTFARTFGQLHYIASLGCPVPGREAKIFLSDKIFTHFDKEENINNQRGKLEDDLVRIYNILNQATPDSIIILNEIFTSTTLQDAVFLSKMIMDKIIQLDLLCIWVTFIDELASVSEKTVSMASTVVPENPAVRTFKIIRKPADGLAYALSIAEKYQLTYESLKKRIAS